MPGKSAVARAPGPGRKQNGFNYSCVEELWYQSGCARSFPCYPLCWVCRVCQSPLALLRASVERAVVD